MDLLRWIELLAALLLGLFSAVMLWNIRGLRTRMIDYDVAGRQDYLTAKRRPLNQAVIGDAESDREESVLTYQIIGGIAGVMALVLAVVALT